MNRSADHRQIKAEGRLDIMEARTHKEKVRMSNDGSSVGLDGGPSAAERRWLEPRTRPLPGVYTSIQKALSIRSGPLNATWTNRCFHSRHKPNAAQSHYWAAAPDTPRALSDGDARRQAHGSCWDKLLQFLRCPGRHTSLRTLESAAATPRSGRATVTSDMSDSCLAH